MSASGGEELPTEIKEAARNVELNLLPEKSRKVYQQAYRQFIDFCDTKNIKQYSEEVLLVYFAELAKKFKSSTLWSIHSMLKTTLNINNNIDISRYQKLTAYLKRQSKGYKPKKSRILEQSHIEEFLQKAPDDDYLSTKVALIFSLAGACRCDELMKIKLEDIQDLEEKLLITLPDTKTGKSRSFVIKDYLEIYRKYASSRPNMESSRFFYKYAAGKGYRQHVGIHKFGKMPTEIATFLRLPHAKEYTGHCFRRSSATLLVNSGGNLTMLKRLGGWRSTTVAEGYIEDSINSKTAIAEKIFTSSSSSSSSVGVSQSQSTTATYIGNKETVKSIFEERNPVCFNNCSNFTVNVSLNLK